MKHKSNKDITRVLYISDMFIYGGREKYCLNVIDHIDRTKYQIDVLLPGYYYHSNEHALTERNVPVIKYYERKKLKVIAEFKKIFEAGQYDIVHIMLGYITIDYMLFAIMWRAKYHYKIIVHSHTSNQGKEIPERNGKRFKVLLPLVKYYAACSRNAAEFMFGTHRTCQILNNGIDIERFSHMVMPHAELMQKYEISDKNMNLITVARMSKEKNPYFLIDVIDRLRQYIPNLMLHWVGEGDMEKELKAYIEGKNVKEHIHFLGTQEHVEEILSCCDYFVLPSLFEGLPLTLIEAQAAGLAVFTSDTVTREVDCGGCTFISLEKSAQEWAEQIYQQIKENKKPEINGKLLERYDIKNTVADLERFYDSIL